MLATLIMAVAASCVVEQIPEAPGNAAIQLATAYQIDDRDELGRRLCAAITTASSFESGDYLTHGPLAAFREAMVRAAAAESNTVGGASEFSPREEVELDDDVAWTELDFVGPEVNETWRLHMVREDGRWKACGAELRE